jgi:hypothetical protein
LNKLALLVVPALLLQILATTQFDTSQLELKRTLLLASYVILVVGVLGLRGRVTRVLAVAGVLLNAAPIAANHGLMPTTQDAVEQATGTPPELYSSRIGSKDIVLPRDEIRVYGLSDRIVVQRMHNVVSVGDIVLFTALIAYVFASIVAMIRPNRRPLNAHSPPSGAVH